MKIFLDTDTCIYFLKGETEVVKNITALSPDMIKIPAIVLGELIDGAITSHHPKRVLDVVKSFCAPFEIVPFDNECGLIYGHLRSELRKKGAMIGANDLLIASIVLNKHGLLMTNNLKEFSRVANLKCINPFE